MSVLDDWSSCKDDYTWNPSMYEYECNKASKFVEYLDIKKYSCEKHLFGKLLLACEDEIFNTTETSLDDNKVTKPSHGFIRNYTLVIISCHFY